MAAWISGANGSYRWAFLLPALANAAGLGLVAVLVAERRRAAWSLAATPA
jgi:hypothetical protein